MIIGKLQYELGRLINQNVGKTDKVLLGILQKKYNNIPLYIKFTNLYQSPKSKREVRRKDITIFNESDKKLIKSHLIKSTSPFSEQVNDFINKV